jgi:Peptidase M15
MASEDDEFDKYGGVKPKPKGQPLVNAQGAGPVNWQAAKAATGLDPSVARFAAALAAGGFGDLPITSAVRSASRNAAVNGAKGSQHLLGRALDINVSGLADEQKAQVLDLAVRAGVKGVGIYPGGRTLHLDTREGGAATWGAGKNTYAGVPLNAQPGWAQGALKAMMAGVQPESARAPQPALPPVSAKSSPEDEEFNRYAPPKSARPQAAPTAPLDFRTLPQNDPRYWNSFQQAAPNMKRDPAFPGVVWQDGKGYDERTGQLVANEPPQETRWGTPEALASGATLGYMPKIAGAVAGTVSGDPEAGERLEADLTEAQRRARARDPWGTMGMEIAGSLPTTIAGGAAVNAALRPLGPVGRFAAGAGRGRAQAPSEFFNGALQGGLGNMATAGLQENRDVTLGQLGIEGAIGGGLLTGAMGRIGAMSPSRMVPTRQMGIAAEEAQDLVGGTLSAGQIAPQRVIPHNASEQLANFTKRMAKTFDADQVMEKYGVDGFNEQVFREARDNLSQQYQSIFQQMAPIPRIDTPLDAKLNRVWSEAQLLSPEDQNTLGRAISMIYSKQGPNGVEPEALQKLMKWEGPLGELRQSKNSDVRNLAKDLQKDLQDFMERNARDINGNRSPQLVREYRKLNAKWANMENLEPAILEAINPASSLGMGYIDPAKLGQLERNATKNARVKNPDIRAAMRSGAALPRRSDLKEAPPGKAIRNALGGGAVGAAGGLAAAGLEGVPALTAQILQWGPGIALTGAAGAAAFGGSRALQNNLMTRPGTVKKVIENSRRGYGPSTRANLLATPAGQVYKHDWSEYNKDDVAPVRPGPLRSN